MQNVVNTSNSHSLQAPNVQKVGSAIHRINHYPVDNTIGFANAYPLDSNLYGPNAAVISSRLLRRFVRKMEK